MALREAFLNSLVHADYSAPGSLESILPGQALERLRQAFGERADALFGDALTVLSFVAMEGTASHRSLRLRVDMHTADLSGLLKMLCLRDFLVPTGRGNGTTYALKNGGKATPEASGPPVKVESLGKNAASPPQKVASSGEKVASSPQKVASSKLERALLAAAVGWRTVAELGEATGRSAKHLRGKVIPALLSAGRLERRYPDPTHPHQAYRAVPPAG